MFYVIASVYAVGFVSYLILGSGDLQPWAREPYTEETYKKPGETPADEEENKKLTSDV